MGSENGFKFLLLIFHLFRSYEADESGKHVMEGNENLNKLRIKWCICFEMKQD